MKKRIFLIIATLLLVFTLSACNLENREVELAANVSFNHEMVEKTTQQVTVQVESYEQNLKDLQVTYYGKTPEVATISEEGLIKALVPGKADFEVVIEIGEAKKVIEFSVNVQALQYTIKYNLDGGVNSELNPEGFVEADLPLELQPATKAGYTFLGWEYEGEMIEALPAGTIRNVELTAKWEIVEYAISYDLAGGAHVGEAPVKYTVAEEVVLGAATKAGYEFAGWYLGEEKVEKVEAGSTGDLALVAKWEVVEYTISYELAGGELADAPTKYTVEDEVVLAVPTKAEHRFLGWYLNGVKVEKIAAGTTGDLALEAKWELDKYTISYDLAGGQVEGGYVYDEAKATQEFKLTKYLNYDVNGLAASLRDKANLTWWGHIALKATADPEVFEIIQIANKSTGITVEFDYVIAWHSACTDTASKAVMDAILKASAEYVGDYVVIKGIPTAAGDAEMTVKVFEASDVVYDDGLQNEYTQKEEVVLPVPTKAGYEFLGWYEGETKVEKIEMGSYGNKAFVAKWEAVEYTINFDLQGGELAQKVYTFEEIGNEFLADFNKYGNCELGKVEFASESHPEVKQALASLEMLTKWQWYFEFMLEDLKSIHGNTSNVYVTETYSVLEKIIALDTTAIEISGNARTLIRYYSGGMMQGIKGSDGNTTFAALCADFSEQARKDALVKAANADSANVYTIEDEVELPVPTKADHTFLGWYLGETKVEKIEKGTTGDLTLVAKWEANQPEEPKHEHVACPVCGLCTAEDCDGEAAEKCQGHEPEQPEQPGKVVYVGAGKDYETLDAAVQGVEDGTTIVLEAGEYTLSVVIAKSVVIKGPNADEKAPANTHPEALINVAKDVAGNLAAKNIEFNGVHLKGTGGGAGIPGVSFQDGGNVEKLVFKSCVLSDTNTLLKMQGNSANIELLIQDCHIRTIGQFVLWTTKATSKVLLIGNQVDGATCGAVTNDAAALFRVRYGSLEAYNNYFNGDSANVPGYFECSADASIIKYNTFFNVTRYVHPTANNNIVFDENLYLYEGVAALKAPAEVKGNGVTADRFVATSEEDRAKRYAAAFGGEVEERYFEIAYDAKGGQLDSNAPTSFDSETGLAVLPKATKAGMIFAGWLLDGQLVESIPAGTKNDVVLVASWKEIALYVGANEEYKTIAEALAAAKPGEKIVLTAGTYSEAITLNVNGITLAGKEGEKAVLTGAITIEAKNVTIEGLSFTGDATIRGKQVINFTFKNNHVYDTTEAANAWKEGSGYTYGFIYINSGSSNSLSQNLAFLNNKFENVSDANVNMAYVYNVSFDSNLFKNFDRDAIRFDTGGYNYGALAFTNNEFTQDSLGGYNGIYFRIYGGPGDNDTKVLIEGNKFVNIGNSSAGLYSGAVSARNYQERGADFQIIGNYFEKCYNYIRIRNNGTAPNHSQTTWACNIENNAFIGLPQSYYYAQWNAASCPTDTDPIRTKFGANYYEDNEGKVISDLSAYESYFKQVADKGTAVAAKPELKAAAPVYFYAISYTLKGGELASAGLTSFNRLMDAYTLPLPTKENYKFVGWFVGDKQVEVLDATISSDLDLVAVWEVIPGEYYPITYELDGGQVEGEKEYFSGVEFVLPIPTKEGYKFLGWSLEQNSTNYITQLEASQKGAVTVFANWELIVYNEIEYDFAGGASEELYIANGETEAYYDITSYNSSNGVSFWGGGYASYIYLTNSANDPKATFSDRIYIGRDANTGLWTVVGKLVSGGSSWPLGAEYVISISSSYGSYASVRGIAGKINIGDTVAFVGDFQTATADSPVRVKFFNSLPENSVLKVTASNADELITPTRLGFKFLGWYDSADKKYESMKDVTADVKLTAKWEALTPVTDIVVEGVLSEVLDGESFQVNASVLPLDAFFKGVEFATSNRDIFTVSKDGLVTAINPGTATLTITDFMGYVTKTYEITVHAIDSVDVSFSEGYTGILEPGQTVQLTAKAFGKNAANASFKYSVADELIAKVDENGLVTAVAKGVTALIIKDETGTLDTLEIMIQVESLADETAVDEILKILAENNYALVDAGNVCLYNDGKNKVYDSLTGSVNRVLFDVFTINTQYYATSEANPNNHRERRFNDTFQDSIEFVTVHDTATLTAGPVAIAQNMSSGETSIHYTVGDDQIYGVVPEKYIAYHAGDGTGTPFRWINTGVDGVAGVAPKFACVQKGDKWYFTVNGQETNIEVPLTGKRSNGTVATLTNPNENFTELGPVWKVQDGKYYMGNTWVCFTQVAAGALGSFGGNNNSIGIEMCMNTSGDMIDTYQRTARLVADICIRNGLDTTRVKQHNTWTGKNCPQTLLEGNYWDEFMLMVQANYDIYSKYPTAEITMVSNNPDIVDNTGRVYKEPAQTTTVSYTVTVKVGDVSKSMTLYSVVPGSTTWEHWDGTYNCPIEWNKGYYSIQVK